MATPFYKPTEYEYSPESSNEYSAEYSAEYSPKECEYSNEYSDEYEYSPIKQQNVKSYYAAATSVGAAYQSGYQGTYQTGYHGGYNGGYHGSYQSGYQGAYQGAGAGAGAGTDYIKRKTNIMCANCGGYGHLYKSCNHPVISYGIICYKLMFDEDTKTFIPKFLMVQRKDSLSYVEFIRGKYCIQNRNYLIKLFSNMTEEEHTRIKAHTFDSLWKIMWCKTEDETNKNFTKEYNEACEKFNQLKKGYYLKANDNTTTHFSLSYLLESTKAQFIHTEWGFPKGRRNINEDDMSCALREFREESGINLKSIRFLHDIKPLEEIFSGSNKIRYKHVYYLSKYVGETSDTMITNHCKEIKKVEWFTFDEMINNIRPYNVERKELAKRVLSVILKKQRY